MKNKFYSFFRFNSFFKKKLNKKCINKNLWVPLVFSPFLFAKNVLFLEKDEDNESNELSFKDIIRGEYENKIRTFSPIEKKFLIFSKIKSSDEVKMSYFQFLDSVVPFQYMKTLNEEKLIELLTNNLLFNDLLKKIDINNDGFINFEEYVIWNLIISLKLSDLKEKFPRGTLTREQFSEYLMGDLNLYNIHKVTDKAFIDARMIKSDHDTIYKTLVDFTSKCFKDSIVSIDKDIDNLVVELSLIMLLYEFYRIPTDKKDFISGETFAKVILSYINIYKTKTFKKKIDEKLVNVDYEISINQFIHFFLFLRYLSNSKMKLFNEKSKYNLDDLKTLSKDYLKSSKNIPNMKKEITESQLKSLIELLDENGDGFLQLEEIKGILKRRTKNTQAAKDFIEETHSIKQFFVQGFNFIKDNLWFTK